MIVITVMASLLLTDSWLFFLTEFIRGNSKYHYYGIRVKPDSPLNRLQEDTQYMAMRQQPVHQKQRSELSPQDLPFLLFSVPFHLPCSLLHFYNFQHVSFYSVLFRYCFYFYLVSNYSFKWHLTCDSCLSFCLPSLYSSVRLVTLFHALFIFFHGCQCFSSPNFQHKTFNQTLQHGCFQF